MSTNSHIEWTDATWNPVTGCSAVSPGCANCYAAKMTKRLAAMGREDYVGLLNSHGHFNGEVNQLPERLGVPLKWRKPRMVFVNSMSDLFHEAIPDKFIRMVFAIMSACGQHTFQVLTKRAERMADWFAGDENSLSACQAELVASDWWCDVRPDRTPTNRDRIRDTSQINGTCRGVGDGNYWPLGNVWLGVSAEDNERAYERIPHLIDCPAAVRFVSAEPLLGPIDFSGFFGGEYVAAPGDVVEPNYNFGIDWVIVGGESGPKSRPMKAAWVREIRDRCEAASVPLFFKQWGEWCDVDNMPEAVYADIDNAHNLAGHGQNEWRVGKRRAGAMIDGREHREWPAVATECV